MKQHALEFGWEISFPGDWTSEQDADGTYIFYPPNDSTTAYATVFHAEKQGESAPLEVMVSAFMRSLPKNVKEIPLSVEGHSCKAFYSKDSDGVYRIIAGFFAEGDLLSLNVYSEKESAVWSVLEYFKSVTRR